MNKHLLIISTNTLSVLIDNSSSVDEELNFNNDKQSNI